MDRESTDPQPVFWSHPVFIHHQTPVLLPLLWLSNASASKDICVYDAIVEVESGQHQGLGTPVLRSRCLFESPVCSRCRVVSVVVCSVTLNVMLFLNLYALLLAVV